MMHWLSFRFSLRYLVIFVTISGTGALGFRHFVFPPRSVVNLVHKLDQLQFGMPAGELRAALSLPQPATSVRENGVGDFIVFSDYDKWYLQGDCELIVYYEPGSRGSLEFSTAVVMNRFDDVFFLKAPRVKTD